MSHDHGNLAVPLIVVAPGWCGLLSGKKAEVQNKEQKWVCGWHGDCAGGCYKMHCKCEVCGQTCGQVGIAAGGHAMDCKQAKGARSLDSLTPQWGSFRGKKQQKCLMWMICDLFCFLLSLLANISSLFYFFIWWLFYVNSYLELNMLHTSLYHKQMTWHGF